MTVKARPMQDSYLGLGHRIPVEEDSATQMRMRQAVAILARFAGAAKIDTAARLSCVLPI